MTLRRGEIAATECLLSSKEYHDAEVRRRAEDESRARLTALVRDAGQALLREPMGHWDWFEPDIEGRPAHEIRWLYRIEAPTVTALQGYVAMSDDQSTPRKRGWRLVLLTLCRRTEPHRPHAWGYRRFCRGGWDSRWTQQPS